MSVGPLPCENLCAEEDTDDGLGAFRGLVVAVLLSLPFWLIVGLVVWS